MTTIVKRVVSCACVALFSSWSGAAAQSPETCPLHAQHMKARAAAAGHGDGAHAEMLARGGKVMGFDQRATSHHFRLSRAGGEIEVHVNDPADAASKAAVTEHLREIAAQFSRGDFSIPRQVHGETPEGVDQLKALGAQVRYTFEPADHGARVRLAGRTPRAIAAIHTFLRYQIREHRTGDSMKVD